jgi:hypothetical protein
MSVSTPDRRHNFAYTNTVNIPVRRNAHHPQLPETPFWRTKSVTKLGVSVEKVVATIDTPNNHHGIFRPAKKNEVVSLPALRDAHNPTARDNKKYVPIIYQSKVDNFIYISN